MSYTFVYSWPCCFLIGIVGVLLWLTTPWQRDLPIDDTVVAYSVYSKCTPNGIDITIEFSKLGDKSSIFWSADAYSVEYRANDEMWIPLPLSDFVSRPYDPKKVGMREKGTVAGIDREASLTWEIPHPEILVSDSGVMDFDLSTVDRIYVTLYFVNEFWDQESRKISALEDIWNGYICVPVDVLTSGQ